MNRTENWPELIANFRTNRKLTQAAFAEHLNVTQQTVSRWESGKQLPYPPALEQLRTVVGATTISTKDAWRQRIEMSWRLEALFDKGWRYLAISKKLQSLTKRPAKNRMGTTLADVPELQEAAAIMARIPFFTGGIRVLKARVSLFWPDIAFAGDVEIWPVLTGSDEILAHVVATPNPTWIAEPLPPGMRILHFHAVRIDGAVLGDPDDRART